MNSKFKKRSMQNELLDSPDVSQKLLVQNLQELDFLNRTTGGHAISLEGIKQLVDDESRSYHILDLGCGSGDWLRYMAEWAKTTGVRLKLTGIDMNPDAIDYLRLKSRNYPEIKGLAGDYKKFLTHSSVDIFHCALFCHHLDNPELAYLFQQMRLNAHVGFVVNDLHRSPYAYYAAKISTSVLGGSILSRHDGPLSVLKGFKERELRQLLKEAGVAEYVIHRRRFFRFLIVGRTVDSMNTQTIK